MADDDDTGGNAPAKDRKKQIKNEHILIGVGIVTLVVLVVLSKKGSSSSANNGNAQSLADQNAQLQNELEQQQLMDQSYAGAYSSPYQSGYESSLYQDPYEQEFASLMQNPNFTDLINGINPFASTSTITTSPSTTTPGSGPSSGSSPQTDVYNGQTWNPIETAGGVEEWINEEGEYYYGTQGPSAAAPFGTDVNGVPLPSAASFKKQA